MNSVLRYAGSIVVTGLTAAYSYYPTYHWIPVVLGVAANLGIHVVPAITQAANAKAKSGEDPTQS